MKATTLDRQVKRFVLGDFSRITPGTVKLGALVAVPHLPVANASTYGHTPPAIPELVAVRRAALDGKCQACGAGWLPIDVTCNAPLLRLNHAADCATQAALELWMRRVGFTSGLADLVWALLPPGADGEQQ